jgi:hypothetical protein
MKMRALKAIKPTNTELNTDMAFLLERRHHRSTTVPFRFMDELSDKFKRGI